MTETYCRFCLRHHADPWSGVTSYIVNRPLLGMPICKACWHYLSVVEWRIYALLLSLAARYAQDRRGGE